MTLKEIAQAAVEEAEQEDNDGYDMSEPLPDYDSDQSTEAQQKPKTEE